LENRCGPLSPRPAQLSVDPSPSTRSRPASQPITTPPSLADGARLLAPSSPKFPLIRPRVSSLAKFPVTGRPPVTTMRHKVAHVFSCRLEPSCRLWCAVASHHRFSAVACHCSSQDATPGARRRSLVLPAPLVELTWSKVCRLDPDVALSVHACSRVGAMRWHAHARRVALSRATPLSSALELTTY
jgi:hypothetical protein